MERKYDHNSRIIYVDPKGAHHEALVTAWWGVPGASASYGADATEVFGCPVHAYQSETGEPGCNLLYMSKDPSRHDSCGRQMERATSVVHKTKQAAPANYWCWPDEV